MLKFAAHYQLKLNFYQSLYMLLSNIPKKSRSHFQENILLKIELMLKQLSLLGLRRIKLVWSSEWIQF